MMDEIVIKHIQERVQALQIRKDTRFNKMNENKNNSIC